MHTFVCRNVNLFSNLISQNLNAYFASGVTVASMVKFTTALVSPFIQRPPLFRVDFTCRYPFLWRRNSFSKYTYHKHKLHSAIVLLEHKRLFHAQEKLYKEISRCCRPFPTSVHRCVKYSILRVHLPPGGAWTPPPKKKKLPQAQLFNSFFTDVCMNTDRDFPNVVALPWVAGSKVAYLIRFSSTSSLFESLQCDRPFRLGSLKLEMRTKHKARVLRACSLIQCFAVFLVRRTCNKSSLLCRHLSQNYLKSQTPQHNSR